MEERKEGIKGRAENRGLMIDFLQSWQEGWTAGHLAILFQDFEKVDESVSVMVLISILGRHSAPAAAWIHKHRLSKPQKTPRSIFLLTGDRH